MRGSSSGLHIRHFSRFAPFGSCKYRRDILALVTATYHTKPWETKAYLEYVASLVVLYGPPEAPQHCRNLLGVEEREEAIQQHLQLHRHRMEALGGWLVWWHGVVVNCKL